MSSPQPPLKRKVSGFPRSLGTFPRTKWTYIHWPVFASGETNLMCMHAGREASLRWTDALARPMKKDARLELDEVDLAAAVFDKAEQLCAAVCPCLTPATTEFAMSEASRTRLLIPPAG